MFQLRPVVAFLAAVALAAPAAAGDNNAPRAVIAVAAPSTPSTPTQAPDAPSSVKAQEAFATATARAQDGDTAGAMQAYTTVISLEPSFAQGHFERGLLKAQSNDLNGAVVDFGAAAKRAPRISWLRAQALYERARCLSKQMDAPTAASDASDALEIRPDFVEALALRAGAKNDMGQAMLAIEDADAAVALDGDYAPARLERARAYVAMHKPDPAIADLTAMIESLKTIERTDDDNALLVKALAARGQAFDSIGEVRKAINDYSGALALAPESYDALLGRAIALSRLGQNEQALVDCRKAIACAPPFTKNDTPAHRLLPRLEEFANKAPATANVGER